ncbi:hypothetical protein N5079_13690 [Planotetraspora sp. A-T 1434]|uniref:trypsin-like serine peptidase n=1 Tax=Planotetraspora sp. A-T 1434 TaxID=2979219 RepID=UPI0021BEE660|nr:hypothetical protein [Planotetraspora sp. A-T 1434]MCT9931270.1 hypothetical protein [Planotetraspora sp. A-T 1434]
MARHLALSIGGVVAAASVVAMLVNPGTAAPASMRPVSGGTSISLKDISLRDGVSSFALAPSAADMQRVASYWSPERLKQASIYEPSTKPSPTAKTSTSALEVGPALSARPTTASAAHGSAKDPSVPPMVGKVFFKVGDKEYWCSASAVHSPYKNLVATAGHCAFSLPQDKPVEDWIFIPSYHEGKADAGIYVGHTLYMHEDFAGQGDFDRDYAFVTVHRGFTWQPYTAGGKVQYRSVDAGLLEDKVGAFLFSSNKPIGRGVFAFGYPAGAQPDGSRPYSGQTVKMCYGVTEKRFAAAPTWQVEHGVRLPDCAFTSGASGGPWVIGYNSAKKTGYLNGITSLTWNLNGGGRVDAISSPYFNTLTQRVYQRATRQSTS